ncbi:MAG: regulatory protein RecX [Chloroflexota bacterium]
MEVALRFLGSRPRTRSELDRRLRRAGAEGAVVEATLERLVAMGHLDDVAFARWWTEQRDRHAPRGRRMLEAELRQRGVPREVIQAHREAGVGERAPEDEGLPENDEERARVALERHLRGRPMPTDRPALQRLGMYLVSRGFDSETARATIRSVATGESDEA